MKLKIEKWIDDRHMLYSEEGDAIELFNESIMCYKIGAYRSAYMMSYLGFESIIKYRILNTTDFPKEIPSKKLELMRSRLKDDNVWEEELSNVICTGKPDKKSEKPDMRLFKFNNHDAIVTHYRQLKNTRNVCAHYKHNTIDHSTVESLWNFVIDDLEEFHVGGSMEYFTTSVVDSFDIAKSDERENYNFEISKLSSLLDFDGFREFLGLVDRMYRSLSSRAIQSNYDLFFKELTLSDNKIIRDALYSYLVTDSFSVCNKLIRFHEKYGYFVNQYLSENIEYRKTVWNNYLNHLGYYNKHPWRMFEIYNKFDLLNEQELDIFFEEIIKNNSLVSGLTMYADETVTDILISKGFSIALLKHIKNICYRDFLRANSHEDLFFCAIKYCEVDKYLYENTEFLLRQRNPGTTIYDNISNLLNESKIKSKYIQFEATCNESGISDYFGW